ncbi:Glutamyl-tRNA(Gln) amidotransferase subunit C [Candidatus Brocadiaceae bacterium S225]|uniref:Aspartyl/glutamyl-tRNA(Asn/Gln) amidotransferase subunit C n=1 Tax=Candidatus Scalindua brodae TaxID=237368 RepID=A0A0B0EHF4_9BACT|nr:MAG: aspartyl/glutamyl-tRNA amidotransferase subunit C [Candidatus Scalindua brodae]TWU35426.1 Glutamyl-tRNA(Gln) amidotransferase subunit C [Candidatus Brocadiaceae bacterium S225]
MDIGIKQIEQVARLSRIKLTDEEKGFFREQLTDILSYVEKLNELDTDGVQPMAYATSLKNVFREDHQESSFPRQQILELSPSSANGFFKVPKVLE